MPLDLSGNYWLHFGSTSSWHSFGYFLVIAADMAPIVRVFDIQGNQSHPASLLLLFLSHIGRWIFPVGILFRILLSGRVTIVVKKHGPLFFLLLLDRLFRITFWVDHIVCISTLGSPSFFAKLAERIHVLFEHEVRRVWTCVEHFFLGILNLIFETNEVLLFFDRLIKVVYFRC